MEDANVITITRWNFQSPEVLNDWNRWAKASRTPLAMSSGMVMDIERCFSLQEKSIYVNSIIISHFKNIENYIGYLHSPQHEAVTKDAEKTWGDKIQYSWRTVFILVRHFKGMQTTHADAGNVVDKTTRLKEFSEGNEPITLLRGLRLSREEWKRYDKWLIEWGNDVYVPMLLKIPGITEYSHYWLSPINLGAPDFEIMQNPEYPQDLSIIRFENLQGYQNFLKSKELAVFDKTLATVLPPGMDYKWNTPYRIARRWSR